MGRLTDIFCGSSVGAYDRRVRSSLAAGHIDEAHRLLAKAQARHPYARSLSELHMMVERAQSRDEIRRLELRIAAVADVRSYERLVEIYHNLGLEEESRRTLKLFASAHPDLDTPQLLLGEACMRDFYEDLQARDGRMAQEHLQRAARLNPQALKPRLLLAEFYYCVGARRALALVRGALERFSGDAASLAPVFRAMDAVADVDAPLSIEGVLERIEVEGQLPHEPAEWPLATPRVKEARLEEERAIRAAHEAVKGKDAEEVVVLRRNGTLLVHATADELFAPEEPSSEDMGTPQDEDSQEPAAQAPPEPGLVSVVRAVARTVTAQAREFDLGRFRRCVLEGSFGLVICGRWGGVIAAARRSSRQDPLRVWERLCQRLDGAAIEDVA